MALKNYTTEVSAQKTVGEIQNILAAHRASAILTEYDDAGKVTALSFKVKTPGGIRPFRLPVNTEAVYKLLNRQRKYPIEAWETERVKAQQAQAERVGWRILKDWVDAQMALIETEMVSLEEVFLPYLLVSDQKTLYQAMNNRGFMLPEGKPE